jgi:hypothetical protein
MSKPHLFVFVSVLVFLLCSTGQAQVVWHFHDFGTAVFDEHNNSSDLIVDRLSGSNGATLDQDLQVDGFERFDIEGMNFAYDDFYLYLSITSSFGAAAYSDKYRRWLSEGDLFFGVNGGSYDYAIDVSTHQLMKISKWDYVSLKSGVNNGDLGVQGAIGPYTIGQGRVQGVVSTMYGQYRSLETNYLRPGNGDTWIKEYRISRSDLGRDLDYGTISFHTTLENGADVARKDFGYVPEAGSLILLGVGLAGAGLFMKFRTQVRTRLGNRTQIEKDIE